LSKQVEKMFKVRTEMSEFGFVQINNNIKGRLGKEGNIGGGIEKEGR